MPGCQFGGKSYTNCMITVVFDDRTWKGELTIEGSNKGDSSPTVLLTANVVGGHNTPMGTFHASRWEKDHTSNKYGSLADTPYSKTLMGGNVFGPFQLHIRELEDRGIYIHGTMGPTWNPSTNLNALISPTSHGCVRMANTGNISLHDMMPHPVDNVIVIKKKVP